MRKHLRNIMQSVTAFRVLYAGVALYTLRHSALGFATLEPDASIAWALLAALVVDVGMLLAAEALRKRVTLWMTLGLALSAMLSAFSQLLFAVTNAAPLTVAAGAQWMSAFANMIIQWRVVLLPLAMPAMVIVYAFASKQSGDADHAPAKTQDAEQTETQVRTIDALPVIMRGNNGTVAGTFREQIVALLEQNPSLSDNALQSTVGCRDMRTVRAAREAWEVTHETVQ